MAAEAMQWAGALWGRQWRNWAVAGLLLLLGAGTALARETPQQVSEIGLLWKIVQPGSGKASYLFGTIHSEDPRVTALPAAVQSAFTQSSRYVMEIIPDQASMAAASQAMLLEQGSSLDRVVGAPLFDKTARILQELGVPREAAGRFKPWAAMVIMSMPRLKTGQVLDFVLYSAALQAGKSQAGLETALEQISVFDTLPLAEQKVLLADTVAQYPQMATMMEQMHVAYLDRNLTRLVALSEQYSREGDAKLAARINEALVDHRNLRMAERMQPYLKEGGAFIAVGALHLPGQAGLINLLRKRGYVLSAVY